MVRLNGLRVTPEEARSIVKYLSTYHGLAPEEAKAVMYLPEHRMHRRNRIFPNDAVKGACAQCHAFGAAMSWRRSKDDWKLLANLHVAMYATADQAFRTRSEYGQRRKRSTHRDGERRSCGIAGRYGDRLSEPSGSLAYAGMGGMASAYAAAENGRTLAGVGGDSRQMEIYGGDACGAGRGRDEFMTHVTLTSMKDGSKLIRSGSGLGVCRVFLERSIERIERAGRPPTICKRICGKRCGWRRIRQWAKAAGSLASIRSSASM